MKLPRRKFLHLAARAAALPAVSRFAWHKPIRRGRCGAPPRGDFTMAMLDQLSA
jgi:hypothetical protein